MNRSQKIRFNKGRKSALNGDFETAVPVFQRIADENEEAVNASLAEIYGFLFDWENCLLNAGKFVANPNATYAGNVFDDMIRLIGRAGAETQNWASVKSICENAERRISAANYRNHLTMRYFKILKNLKDYAKRKGDAPHELIRIFGIESKTIADNYSAFKKAVDNIYVFRSDLKGKTNETIRHKLALAIGYEMFDEALNIFFENENLPIYDFQFLIPVIKHLVKIGEKEKAWHVVKNNIKNWFPVDIVQIAPVDLLTDKNLKKIINPERGLEILKTPRGV